MQRLKKRAAGTVRTLAVLWSAVGGLLIVSLLSTTARACPLCRSATGTAVRSAILDASFGSCLLVSVLPFAVMAILVKIILGLLTPRTRQAPGKPPWKENGWQ